MKKLYTIAWIIASSLSFTSCQSETTKTSTDLKKNNVIYLHNIVTKTDNAQSAFNSIINQNKLVLVDYYASWCGPCKIMSPIIDQVAKQFPNVVFLKVDVDQFRQVANGIKSIPVLRLFENGKQVYSQPGALTQIKLIELLKKYA